jgi:hypothetical protein
MQRSWPDNGESGVQNLNGGRARLWGDRRLLAHHSEVTGENGCIWDGPNDELPVFQMAACLAGRLSHRQTLKLVFININFKKNSVPAAVTRLYASVDFFFEISTSGV